MVGAVGADAEIRAALRARFAAAGLQRAGPLPAALVAMTGHRGKVVGDECSVISFRCRVLRLGSTRENPEQRIEVGKDLDTDEWDCSCAI